MTNMSNTMAVEVQGVQVQLVFSAASNDSVSEVICSILKNSYLRTLQT